MSLSAEEKQRILRAVERDREFRLALMGLLGFSELLDRFSRIEERFVELEEELREARRVMINVANRFGVLSEESFRQAMKYVVGEKLGVAKVERWVYRDKEGIVYECPSIVEVNVVIRNGEHVLVEVKSCVSKADVAELHRIGGLYERVEGIKPKLVIVGGLIDSDAQSIAEDLGVEIIPIMT